MKKDFIQGNRMRDQGEIKIISIIGVLLIGLFLGALIYFFPVINDLYRKEILKETPLQKDDMNKSMNVPGVNDSDSDDKRPEDKQENNNINILDTVAKRDTRRKEDLGSIYLMIYEYKYKKGTFPISLSTVKLNDNNSVAIGIRSASGEEIPHDPNDPQYYYGYVSQDGKNFEISARLENSGDSGCDPDIVSICLYRIKN